MNAVGSIQTRQPVRAWLRFRRSGETTFLARQRMPHPFHITRPFHEPEDPQGMATLYLQSSAGGYYSGDDLGLAVEVESGAALHLTSQASTIVHHARGGEGARSKVALTAGSGSLLEYCPDPNILLAGSALTAEVRLNLARGARAILTDAQLSHDPDGRGAPFSRLKNTVFLFRDGVPCLVDRLDLAGADWHARTGGYGAAGMVIVTGNAEIADDLRGALADLPNTYTGVAHHADRDVALARILATDGVALSRALITAWSTARESLVGETPRVRRK